MSDRDKIQKALKYLYIHLGEAQGILRESNFDDTATTDAYEVQRYLCNELIDILEDTPKKPSVTSSTVTYRVAPNTSTNL